MLLKRVFRMSVKFTKKSKMTYLFCLATFCGYCQNDTSFGSKIENGLPIIAKYYDSLSYFYSLEHVNLFYIEHDNNIECKENFIIKPIYYKDDLLFKKYEYIIFFHGRTYIIDKYFNEYLTKKWAITDLILNNIKRRLLSDDSFVIESTVVLNYEGCENENYKIDYSKGSLHNMLTPKLPHLDIEYINGFIKSIKK
jgi:hypothetical protein